MSTSYSRQSYEDCYELMDNALAANMGVRVGFTDIGEAKHYRVRLNYARTLDQKFNMERYEAGDPRKGKSDYDILSVRIKHVDGRHWVYIQRRKQPEIVEEIKEDDEPVRQAMSFRRF